MKNGILLLKASYIIGAVLMFNLFILMLFPISFFRMYGIGSIIITEELRIAMYFGAPFLLGWAVLMIIGFFKPFEMKYVLFITIVPILTGLLSLHIYCILYDFGDYDNIFNRIVVQIILMGLFIFSLLMKKTE